MNFWNSSFPFFSPIEIGLGGAKRARQVVILQGELIFEFLLVTFLHSCIAKSMEKSLEGERAFQGAPTKRRMLMMGA
ncbi:putative glycerol-3-phosphate acyltransferase [Sesbania bispinosa]|nr:putative glycerol-3-phosphate acyltransferase [Sesbania bispinosa]